MAMIVNLGLSNLLQQTNKVAGLNTHMYMGFFLFSWTIFSKKQLK